MDSSDDNKKKYPMIEKTIPFMSAPTGEINLVPKATMVLVSGPNAGHEYELKPVKTTFGRDPSVADIHLDETSVSRAHSAITYEDGCFIIRDLQSTNGTFVNQKRIVASEIQHGDKIQIGGISFQLVVDLSSDPEVYILNEEDVD